MADEKRIIETATQLFTKHGVKAITIDRIVTDLRTSKRTIYKYFKDKDELLTACIEVYHKKIKAENEAIIETAPNAIVAMGMLHQKILERSYLINPNFYADIYRYHPKLVEIAIDPNTSYGHQQMVHLADWGINDGIFVEDLDIEVVGSTVVWLLKLFKDHDRFPIHKFSKERLTFGTLVPYMRGLCTPKGLKLLKKQEEFFKVSI